MVLPRVPQMPFQSILGLRLAGQVPPTSAGGIHDVTPKESKGANTEKVKSF